MKKMMKKTVSLILMFLLGFLTFYAQSTDNVQIRGRVVSADNEPLVGVSVYTPDYKKGTTTDVDGNYTLIVKSGEVVRFCYVGFECQDLTIKKSGVYNVTLREDAKVLGDVVVTGYYNTESRRSTGSFSVVKSDLLKTSPVENVDKLLQGKIAGVSITSTTGQPGAKVKVRIRGTSTITGDAEPLWVVDGVPLQKEVPVNGSQLIKTGDFTAIQAGGIGSINPQDIESITVLKDASAAAIYGSRAAGGVIVITTKKGNVGKLSVNFSSSLSVQTRPTRDANLMNARQKIDYEKSLWNEFSADGYRRAQEGDYTAYYPRVGIVGQVYSGFGEYAGMSQAEREAYIEELANGPTTDWFDTLYRNSVSNNNYLSVSGGSDKLTFYTSAGFANNEGIGLHSNYKLYSFNSKINVRPSDKVSLTLKADFSYQKSISPSGVVSPMDYAYFANPYERPYNADGSYAPDRTYQSLPLANGTVRNYPTNGFNILREIYETESKLNGATTNLMGNLTWSILDHLRFNGMAAFTYISDQTDTYQGKDTYAAYLDRPFEADLTKSKRVYSSMTQSSMYNMNYLLRGQLNFEKTFNGIHRVMVLGGAEIRKAYAKSISMKRYGYDPITGNTATPVYNPDRELAAGDLQRISDITNDLSGQSIVENAFASFYMAADYVLKNRYIANLSVRSDGSNNFGSKEQFNATWSAGLAWNVDQEKFFRSLSPVMSSLTLKMATGYTGGVNKSVHPLLVMKYLPNNRTMPDGTFYRMGTVGTPPNPLLRWEKTRDMKLAADMGFFNDRLTLLIEAYHRRSFDLVTLALVPSTTGYSSQSYNTSEQLNRGIEFTISGRIIKTKDFGLNASANFAYNQNKLTKYDIPNPGINQENFVGYPLGKIISGKTLGIDPKTGLYTFQLRPDAVITTDADKAYANNYAFYIGVRNAPYTGGVNLSANYKNLTLSVSGNYSLNSLIPNNITPPASYTDVGSVGSTGRRERIPTLLNDLYVAHFNAPAAAAHRWTADNPVTDGYPRLIDVNGPRLYLDTDRPTANFITRSVYFEKVSYLKLNSIAVMYSLPSRWLTKVGISSCGVNFTANNIFTLTNYTGLDPEMPGSVYPQSQVYSLGINIGF